jgi:UDP-N-acetylmuramyl pentapeptide phosphotransferase/UDP-N-acetylglucosamine-1-phosphate transferase
MILGVALGTVAGTAAAIFYIVHHIIVQTTLFLAAGLVEREAGSTSITRIGGLLASAPLVYLFVDLSQYSLLIAIALFIALCLIAIWYLNLFNFMDGMDLITVVQGVSLSIGVVVLQSQYGNSTFQIMLALSITLSLLGFAYFNWPPAKAFMGDAGSYGYGLLTGAILLSCAQSAGYLAAFSLAGFYLLDATSTLFMRLLQGKNLAQAHRDHAYQKALDSGWSKRRVLFCVIICNIGLIGLNTLQLNPMLLAAACLLWTVFWILLLRSGRKT